MGLCGSSVFEERYRDRVQPIMAFIQKLEIPDKDVRKVYKKFEKIDADKGGEVGIDEFFDAFHLTWSTFGERVFLIMEVSGDHKLSFSEFFVGLFNYCTCEHLGLVRFAFDMFDVDHSGSISRAEVRQLYRLVKGKSGNVTVGQRRIKKKKEKKSTQQHADELMNLMDKDGDGEITFEEFRAFEKKMSSLLYPAFNLQREMRKNIIGEGFWKKATQLRKRNAKGSDLIELNHRLQTGQALDRRALRDAAAKREHGRVQYKQGAGKKLTVYVSPDLKADKCSRKLKWQEDIEIFSSVAGDGEGRWYNMKEGGTEDTGEWIQAKYIKIDHTHQKMMRAEQRVAEEDAELKAKDKASHQNGKKKKKSKYTAN
jgi:serine/threonine-protein phosphatase 2B regulatory subunit